VKKAGVVVYLAKETIETEKFVKDEDESAKNNISI
jgi:hypothetical protein